MLKTHQYNHSETRVNWHPHTEHLRNSTSHESKKTRSSSRECKRETLLVLIGKKLKALTSKEF